MISSIDNKTWDYAPSRHSYDGMLERLKKNNPEIEHMTIYFESKFNKDRLGWDKGIKDGAVYFKTHFNKNREEKIRRLTDE